MGGGGETASNKMDFSDLTKLIVTRIQKLEPDNVIKILGCIFLKEPSEQEMMQLAFGPEQVILSKIDEAKAVLGMSSPDDIAVSSQHQSISNASNQYTAFSQSSHLFPSPATFHVPCQYWDSHLASEHHSSLHNLEFSPSTYPDSIFEDYSLRSQGPFFNLEEQIDPASPVGILNYQDSSFSGNLPLRSARRSPSLPEFPIKTCHYYSKGYCKHGATCRYFHGNTFSDGHSQALSPNLNELPSEEHGYSSGSLEKLEVEISELLRSQRGTAVSIASLPMLYYEKYGKNLQGKGYLTESQRQGKSGLNLTKLLARLKNSIRLIDRPHGQHSVVLAEDAPKYMECRNERSEPGETATSSQQIYLTFPAESTFTEDDVSNYFKYGERNLDEAQSSLYMWCSSFGKALQEKSRMIERTPIEKIKSSLYHPSQYLDLDLGFHSMVSRESKSSRINKMQFEEQEKILELERRRFSEFNLAQSPLSQQTYFNCGFDDLKLPEDLMESAFEDYVSTTFDTIKGGSFSDDKTRNASNNNIDQERKWSKKLEGVSSSVECKTETTAVVSVGARMVDAEAMVVYDLFLQNEQAGA
ncbi:hypothetical protein HPP92_007897 [Vanilla planifolia]|uniref:C3H1-type domain-containing protein n=1 Tax=Vanilla planifolia TaxID=51239 RepID=A0A835VAH6_VANPL|nr:hypothetical protein HPP92_007897 [Vanilla planifolia]